LSTTLAEKDPDVDAEYYIDFRDVIVAEALAGTDYEAGSILFFENDTGFYYEVTTAGRTSRWYPNSLPRSSGLTVEYGSCILTCKHPSDVSLGALSSVTWTADPGITVISQFAVGLAAHVTLSGGTDGVDYSLTCRVTPTTTFALEKTIIVPVRSQ